MITGVWGIINGHQSLPFSRVGDRWFFDPPTEDGTYICQFWAEDDYGNVGYNAAILTVVEGSIKCIRPISERFRTLFLADPFECDMTDADRFHTGMIPARFGAEFPDDRWRCTPKPLNCSRNMVEA